MTDETQSKFNITLPTAPSLLGEITACGDDINKAGDVIAKDPQLADEVLNVINAPYFQLVRKINSVSEAGRMLGLTRIFNLTTGRLLKSEVFNSDDKGIPEIWKSSLKIAVLCVLISKKTGLAAADEAYTVALFHNAGMALVANQVSGYWKLVKAAYLREASNISQLEEEKLGTSHAKLGAELATAWGLTPAISQTIALHHSPDSINKQLGKKNDISDLLVTLKIAEYIAKLPSYITRGPDNFEWAVIEQSCLDYLELTEGMFKRFEHNIKTTLSEMKF